MSEAQKDTLLLRRDTCRGCTSADLVQFADFGEVPLAGGHLRPDQVAQERKFPLAVHFCLRCSLVQILDIVPPDVLFQDYQYIASVIKGLADHFASYLSYLRENRFLPSDGFLVEFGSNDGVLLQQVQSSGLRCLGVDASRNVSQMARAKGLPVITAYFTESLAQEIRAEHG